VRDEPEGVATCDAVDFFETQMSFFWGDEMKQKIAKINKKNTSQEKNPKRS
jgi:hypothetical protein